jgi:hypothetical protein
MMYKRKLEDQLEFAFVHHPIGDIALKSDVALGSVLGVADRRDLDLVPERVSIRVVVQYLCRDRLLVRDRRSDLRHVCRVGIPALAVPTVLAVYLRPLIAGKVLKPLVCIDDRIVVLKRPGNEEPIEAAPSARSRIDSSARSSSFSTRSRTIRTKSPSSSRVSPSCFGVSSPLSVVPVEAPAKHPDS